jgi:hypothetical protein
MIEFLKNIFTANDNATFSMTKVIAITAVVSMTYTFISVISQDFQGYGIGVSIIMGALAAKYFVESKPK